jgi:hypothetical protein
MDITLGLWEKGNAALARSHIIRTEDSVAIFDEKIVARITPTVSN